MFALLPDCDVSDCDVSLSADDSGTPADGQSQYLPSIVDILNLGAGGVQVVHHNVQGLTSKLCEISQWLHTCFGSPTVLCCTEIWVKQNCQLITIPGFDMFLSPPLSRPNSNGSQLPGSCMFVSSTLTPTRNDLCERIEAIPAVLNTCCCL